MIRTLILQLALILSIALIVFIALTIANSIGIWYAIMFLAIEAIKDLAFAVAFFRAVTRD